MTSSTSIAMLREQDAHETGDARLVVDQSAKAWALAGMFYRPNQATLTLRQQS